MTFELHASALGAAFAVAEVAAEAGRAAGQKSVEAADERGCTLHVLAKQQDRAAAFEALAEFEGEDAFGIDAGDAEACAAIAGDGGYLVDQLFQQVRPRRAEDVAAEQPEPLNGTQHRGLSEHVKGELHEAVFVVAHDIGTARVHRVTEGQLPGRERAEWIRLGRLSGQTVPQGLWRVVRCQGSRIVEQAVSSGPAARSCVRATRRCWRVLPTA